MMQEMLRLNPLKGLMESVNSRTKLGRCAVPIKEFAESPNKEHDCWFPLGRDNFGVEGGCVSSWARPYEMITTIMLDDSKHSYKYISSFHHVAGRGAW